MDTEQRKGPSASSMCQHPAHSCIQTVARQSPDSIILPCITTHRAGTQRETERKIERESVTTLNLRGWPHTYEAGERHHASSCTPHTQCCAARHARSWQMHTVNAAS